MFILHLYFCCIFRFRMYSLADASGQRTASVALRNCLYLVPLGFLAYNCELLSSRKIVFTFVVIFILQFQHLPRYSDGECEAPLWSLWKFLVGTKAVDFSIIPLSGVLFTYWNIIDIYSSALWYRYRILKHGILYYIRILFHETNWFDGARWITIEDQFF